MSAVLQVWNVERNLRIMKMEQNLQTAVSHIDILVFIAIAVQICYCIYKHFTILGRETMVTRKQFKSVLFLIIFTGGLYHLVFLQDVFADLNTIEGTEYEENTVLHLILYFLTFGLYSLAVYYYLGNRIHRLAPNRGIYIPQKGIHYLAVALSGWLSIIVGVGSVFYLSQNDFNVSMYWLLFALPCCGLIGFITWGLSLRLLTNNFNKLADSYNSSFQNYFNNHNNRWGNI